MKKLLLLFFCQLWLHVAYPQKQGQERIDSLIAGLHKAGEDTAKVNSLNDISLTFFSINPDEGINYANQGLKLARKLNWKKGMAISLINVGINYSYGKAEYSRALEYYLPALNIAEELKDSSILSGIFNNLGGLYSMLNNNNKAIDYLKIAIKISEQTNDKAGLAIDLVNLGATYCDGLKNYSAALECFLKALRIDEELNIQNGTSTLINNIGVVYMNLSEYSNGLESYSKALKLSIEEGSISQRANTLGNIGETYLSMTKSNNQEYINKYLGGNKAACLQLAKTNTDSAIFFNQQVGELHEVFKMYKQKSEIQILQGNYKDAFESYRLYTSIKDSVFNIEKDKKFTQTAMQYEFDKKQTADSLKFEQEKVLENLKLQKQKTITYGGFTGIAITIVLLFFVYRNYSKQRIANQKLKEAQEQLIKSEKMAAFGVMASRVSHEIQNPLNFVNNFSELAEDMVQDIVKSNNEQERTEIAKDLINNLEKIKHHGKRADPIVKQLQEHINKGTAHEYFETK